MASDRLQLTLHPIDLNRAAEQGIITTEQGQALWQFLANRVEASPQPRFDMAHLLWYFGALIIIGMGGVLAETVRDVQFALPPFDAAWARRLVDRLRFREVLYGVRGATAADVDGFCEMAARFSAMVDALGETLHEIDLNPAIVTDKGSIAVDALVIGAQ